MTDQPIDAFRDALAACHELVKLNDKVHSMIHKKASAVFVTPMPPSHRRYLHYRMQITAFKKNAKFILDVLEWGETDLEPLRLQVRTLIDLYASTCFLSSLSEQEQIKRIIGETQQLKDELDPLSPLFRMDEDLAQREGIVLPAVSDYSRRAIRQEWTIGNVKFKDRLDTHDETLPPTLGKDKLRLLWKNTSGQSHGGVFWNTEQAIVDPKYQILTMVIFLNIHFLRAICDCADLDSEFVDQFYFNLDQSGVIKRMIEVWIALRSTYPDTII